MRAPGASETCLAGPSTETRCRRCRIQTCACWRLAARIDAVGAARPDLVGLLGTARSCAPAAPFSFVGSTCARLGPGLQRLSRRARRWCPCSGFRATGVLLRHRRAHAPLTAKSPLPFPVGRRYHQQYPTSRRLPIALRDDVRARSPTGAPDHVPAPATRRSRKLTASVSSNRLTRG